MQTARGKGHTVRFAPTRHSALSTAGKDDAIAVGFEQVPDLLALVALNLDDATFDRATHPAARLEFFPERLQLLVVHPDEAANLGNGFPTLAAFKATDFKTRPGPFGFLFMNDRRWRRDWSLRQTIP